MIRYKNSTAAAVIFALAAGAAQAAPERPSSILDYLAPQYLGRLMVQMVVMGMRSEMDVTYEAISVSDDAQEISISGLRLFPFFDWDQNGDCMITIDRLDVSNTGDVETADLHFEFMGADFGGVCLPPDASGPLAAMGFDHFDADRLYMDMVYDIGSSSLDMTIHAAIRDAGVLELASEFNYVWVLGLSGEFGQEPDPVAALEHLEVSFEDAGLLERIGPMAQQMGMDLSAAGQMAEGGLRQAFSQGGQRPLSEQEAAFVSETAAAIGEFTANGGRFVMSVEPDDVIWLDGGAFADPLALFADLQPKAASGPISTRAVVDPALVTAALGPDAASLSAEDSLTAGLALLTGVGAPRSVEQGRNLLHPLAEAWDADASNAMARALYDAGDPDAYGYALRAAAGGAEGAMALLDAIEGEGASVGAILDAQQLAVDSWPGEAAESAAAQAVLDAADIAAFRSNALAYLAGDEKPRSYRLAYVWASLAAAAGDRSSSGLRDRLDHRLGRGGGDAWSAVRNEIDAEVLSIWTGGLAAKISGK